jgi:hypothetical protein
MAKPGSRRPSADAPGRVAKFRADCPDKSLKKS